MADPYAPHLRQADDLLAQGQVVKAGQIWQAILKQQPDHLEARERLLQVKQRLLALREAEAAATKAAPSAPPPLSPEIPQPSLPLAPTPEPPQPRAPDTMNPERLLADGCTLYDMGQLDDALRKWEQLLAQDPTHALARGYANGARRELGLPALDAPASSAPDLATLPDSDDDLEKLLREAVQLFDMGLTEEAISKWERVLVLDPSHLEVEGYLRQARRELTHPPTSASVGSASTPPAEGHEGQALDLKLRQGEHLLSLQRHEEAAFTFQQALRLAPGDPAALAGLERCRKPGRPGGPPPAAPLAPAPVYQLEPRGRIAMAIVDEGTLGGPEPRGVEPPASLVKPVAGARRGAPLPDRLKEAAERLPWLKEPRVLALMGGSVLILGVTLFFLRGYFRDQELRRAVKAARIAALSPVAQQTHVADLTESPQTLREEAEATLTTDPLRAYLRTETLIARVPGDAAAAQLLEKARAHLPGGVAGASLPEYQKHLQNGDLEAAARVMDALLRAQPSDPGLRSRAGRLQLMLCSAHVGQGKWEAAADDLRRGRALFPDDSNWQARLHLLERVKSLPKAQQTGWIPLLG